MKKIFSIFAIAAAFFAVSCSQVEEDFSTVKEGEEVIVNFTASLPEIATRSYSDGKTATTLTWAVYPENGKTVLLQGTKEFELATTVDMKLVAGKTYDILFWAADASNNAYALNLETQEMTVTYANLTANSESNDAFYAFRSRLQVKGAVNEKIDLKRPFAQINLGTDDYKEARTANLLVGKTSMEAKLANVLNLADGSVTGAEVVRTIPAGTAPCAGENPVVDIENPANDTEKFPVAGYQYLQMNYVLVGADKSIVDCTFYIYEKDTNNQMDPAIVVANVPVQRNYRTNIYGSLLTKPSFFNVTIVPEYTKPDYDVPASVGTLIAAGQNGGNVALTEDVQLDNELVVETGKAMNLDLNGNDITAPAEVVTRAAEEVVAAIRVKGELTINGNGTVYGGSGNAGNYAIIVEEGGKLTINGGTYTTGVDKDGLGNATIYTKGGEIIINGGHFSTAAAYNGIYYVLNEKNPGSGKIMVYGGSFENYDPATGDDNTEGDTYVAEGYESVLAEDGITYVVGLKKEGVTATVMTKDALLAALTTFTSGNANNNVVVLAENIELAENENWTPIFYSAYTAGAVTIDGNGKYISGLDAPLIAGCTQGNSTNVTIKNLTIKDSKMLTMPEGVTTAGNGVFGGAFDATSSLILENCHAVNCEVVSTNYAGLVGYSSASSNSFTNCSATDCKFTGQSIGGIVGHAAGRTFNTIENCNVRGCTFYNTSNRYDKTGFITSTFNLGVNTLTYNANESINNYAYPNSDGTNGIALEKPIGRYWVKAATENNAAVTVSINGVAKTESFSTENEAFPAN